MTTQNIGQAATGQQPPPQAAQPPLQPEAGIGQGVSREEPRSALWANLPANLRSLPQWAVAGADKAPLAAVASGGLRNISVTRPGEWMSFERACAVATANAETITTTVNSDGSICSQVGMDLGFILAEADEFTCIDLDVKNVASHPTDPAKWTSQEDLDRHQCIISVSDSYTERSRSGLGFHVWVRGSIGKGRRKRGGVEVYSQERFIICTGDVHRAVPIADRQAMLSSMISLMETEGALETELRQDQPGDDMGVCIAATALEDPGELGRLMRGEWEGRSYPSHSEADFALLKMLARLTESNGACREAFRLSLLSRRADKPDKYTDKHLNMALRKVRASLAAEATHLEVGQRIAEALFWAAPIPAEPSSQHASVLPAGSSGITLEFAKSTDTATIKLDYLLDPYLPRKCVVGFFGRGSTSKSSFVATMAAHVSRSAGSLWVSVEEPADWIKVRHIGCGGADRSLAVVKAVASKTDAQGRVTASSFDIYQHLEPAIVDAQAGFLAAGKPPLGLVVLDTAVGLTGWAKGETPNDDASVKRLLANLQSLAERHDVTVAIIGHANKGNYDHLADTVMGATAWTNSPRLSFIHAADRREDYAYVVRVAKTNLVTFGAPYRTAPVHTLYTRQDGPDSVLVRVDPGAIVWGDLASMEMFTEATKKPKDDEDSGGKEFVPSHQTLVTTVLQALVEMVLTLGVDQHVTREAVAQRIGKTVDRTRWTKVDSQLILHPVVTIERGPKNAVLYKRRT